MQTAGAEMVDAQNIPAAAALGMPLITVLTVPSLSGRVFVVTAMGSGQV